MSSSEIERLIAERDSARAEVKELRRILKRISNSASEDGEPHIVYTSPKAALRQIMIEARSALQETERDK